MVSTCVLAPLPLESQVPKLEDTAFISALWYLTSTLLDNTLDKTLENASLFMYGLLFI